MVTPAGKGDSGVGSGYATDASFCLHSEMYPDDRPYNGRSVAAFINELLEQKYEVLRLNRDPYSCSQSTGKVRMKSIHHTMTPLMVAAEAKLKAGQSDQ